MRVESDTICDPSIQMILQQFSPTLTRLQSYVKHLMMFIIVDDS